MIHDQERLSLPEFLSNVTVRTGDPLEASALAEMSGYCIEDARAEGWPDLFAASRAVPPQIDRSEVASIDRSRTSGRWALVRGLTYSAPVLAMLALLPPAVTTQEARFLAVAIILAWGGSMATTHVVDTRLRGDPAGAWNVALRVAAACVGFALLCAFALTRAGIVGQPAAVVGLIQVLYFFCASPLMLRRDNSALGVVALLGAASGVASILADWPTAGILYLPSAVEPLRGMAAACLMIPTVLLVAQARAASAGAGRRYRVHATRRDTVAFGAYGAMFGCLVLWGPVAAPQSPVMFLGFVIVAGIAVAELAVARVRQHADMLLAQTFDPDTFVTRARRLVVSGVLMYAVPITVVTGLAAAWMASRPGLEVGLVAAVPAVICLGSAQVISLIGMALNGIRQVAAAISTCTVGLLVLTPATDGTLARVGLYLGAVVLLDIALLFVVLRLAEHPINHL